MSRTLAYLGKSAYGDAIYLYDFEWQCDWYWGGGYLGNCNMHCHFDDCFLKTPDRRGHPLGNFGTPWDANKDKKKIMSNGCAVWEPAEFFMTNVPKHISKNWWRIKDLFKQFYIFKAAAEAYRYGGHCTSEGRTEREKNPKMAAEINAHIEKVIIPEIRKIVKAPENA